MLERHLFKFTRTLHSLHITPLPAAASHAVGPIPSYWRDLKGMYQILGKGIKETQYRRLINLLSELNKLRHLAALGGQEQVAKEIMEVIAKYEKGDRREAVESGLESGRKRPKIDEFGRVYALGRRKTSSARVWVVPIQANSSSNARDGNAKKQGMVELPIQPAQILVNALPAATYFTHAADRERVFRPLKLTGLLTSYNVFCLVRGGGTTGQAEAIAMGVSRALQVLDPAVKGIVRQGKYALVILCRMLILSRQTHASRSENGRAEKDQSRKGEKGICMGQAVDEDFIDSFTFIQLLLLVNP